MLKIMWHSSPPWNYTGYGVQSYGFVKRLIRAGHQVVFVPTCQLHYAPAIQWDGITIYPPGFLSNGEDGLMEWSKRWRPDVEFTLTDVWIYRKDIGMHLRNWHPFVPIDHEPIVPQVAERLRYAKRPIAFSRFGYRVLSEAGFSPYYLPHGVDTSIYQPMKVDRKKILGTDADFVVGIVADNTGTRKALNIQFEGFAKFRRKHDNVKLYCHSIAERITSGLDLVELARLLGILNDVIFIDKWQYMEGVSPQNMAKLYNSFDVLCAASYGEGFGLPIIEAQACGVPVIVSDFSAMSELCGSGWKVKSRPIYTIFSSYQAMPDADEIAEALERCYKMRNRDELKYCALQFAMQYDFDTVFKQYFVPLLNEIEEKRNFTMTCEYPTYNVSWS